MQSAGWLPIYMNAVAGSGSSTTPYNWTTDYNQTPAYTNISYADSETTQRLYVAMSGGSWMPMISSNINSSGGGSINTYYGATTPAGTPWVFVPPMPNAFKYASTYWSGRFQELMVQAQRDLPGITKTFVQINYVIPTTLNGYGFSWQLEANQTGLITAYGVIAYRLDGGTPAIIGTYSPPLAGGSYTTRVNIWLEINTVGADINYHLRFRKNQIDPWNTLLNTTDVASPYAGFKLVPMIVHSMTGDSATSTSISIEAGSGTTTGMEFSNTPGVLT